MASEQIRCRQTRVVQTTDLKSQGVEHAASLPAIAAVAEEFRHRLRAARRFGDQEGKLLPQQAAVFPESHQLRRLESRGKQRLGIFPFPPRDRPDFTPSKERIDSVFLVGPPVSLEEKDHCAAVASGRRDSENVASSAVVLDPVALECFGTGKGGEAELLEQCLVFGDEDHGGKTAVSARKE